MHRPVPSLVLITALALAACSGGSPSSAPTASAAEVLAPLPAPPDLALECVLPTPDATWAKARAQIGGAAAFLPTTAGGLVAVTLRFPLAVSEAIDGRVPAVCAATLANDGASARAVLGVHLRWPDRLLDGLTKGAEARFTSQNDANSHVDVLTPRDPKDASYASGVLGNYLLIASRPDDLTALGPYVARTMPERAKAFPTAGVRIAGVAETQPVDLIARAPSTLFSGTLASAAGPLFRGVEERARERLPSGFAFVADRLSPLEASLPLLTDVDGAELQVTIGDSATRVEVTAPLRKGTPGAKAAAEIAAGSASPLLAFPKDTLAAMLVRRAPQAAGAGSPAGSSPAAEIAKALGVKDPKDESKLDGIASSFDAARGDWTAAGLAFDGTGPSAFVRAAVKDPSALDGALKDFLALADGASPKEPLRGQTLRVTTGKTVLENIPGDVYRVRLARTVEAAKKGAEPPSSPTETPGAVDILFRRSDDVFVAATGYASRDALRAVLTAPTGDSLQKVPEIAGPFAALGEGLTLAAFFDPGRLDASRAGKPGSAAPAPVVIGLGRRLGEATLFARLDAPNAALARLAHWASP